MARLPKLTASRRKFIVEHLTDGRTVLEIMESLKIDRWHYYRWREDDPTFEHETDVARLAKAEAIERELLDVLENGALETQVKRNAEGVQTESTTTRKWYPSTQLRYLERRHPDYRSERIQAGNAIISLPDGQLRTEQLSKHEQRILIGLLRKCGARVSGDG